MVDADMQIFTTKRGNDIFVTNPCSTKTEGKGLAMGLLFLGDLVDPAEMPERGYDTARRLSNDPAAYAHSLKQRYICNATEGRAAVAVCRASIIVPTSSILPSEHPFGFSK